MQALLDSIREQGIRVPLSVYWDRAKYVLIDGERRWRCARKLNLKSVPAIVLPKPSKLENLLMMFNIHNVRVDWDLMPMAEKLGEVRDLATKNGTVPNAKQLAAITGVRLPTVKRALELLDLPLKYRRMLLEEAKKPRSQQTLKPDVFIETYKSLHTIERYTPEVFKEVTKKEYVDSMVNKYLSGVVDSVVGYREVSKIARAERAGGNKKEATRTIIRLVKNKNYGIKDAYKATVAGDYERRDILTRVDTLRKQLSEYHQSYDVDDDLRKALRKLAEQIGKMID
jgi:ParB/RepB/Spo0J family partition protein